MVTQPTSPEQTARASLAQMPSYLQDYVVARQQALDEFLVSNRIKALWQALTDATDTLISQIAPQLTILAVGGYGRRELFPFSDVDLLVLTPHDATAETPAIIAALQHLWDLQIPVSHATRSIAQTIAAAQQDQTIATALMDARFLCGDRKLFLKLKRHLKNEVFGKNAREYVEGKLRERDARHTKLGDSRFLLEPNVKEGKGALRDLQTLNWLTRYCYGLQRASQLVREDLLTREEWHHYREAYLFFSTVRGHLHHLAGRAQERLTFDNQLRIAEALRFPGTTAQQKAEALMQQYFHYTRQVGNLTRIFLALFEEENLRIPQAPFAENAAALPPPYQLTNGRLNFARHADLIAAPHLMVELFSIAQQTRLPIHPRAQLAIARALPHGSQHLPNNAQANQILLQILLHLNPGDFTLRHMNEMGVLSALIPEFQSIHGQMQYDGYHTYTVDEHILMAVHNLGMIESGSWADHLPLTTALAHDLIDRTPLYLALLCHDIAKGRGGGHAEKGQEDVRIIGTRLKLEPSAIELAAWLVKHQELVTETAFKRDLDDPQTIADFVTIVQSPERLRLLLLLTVADLKAVAPNIWNPWKGALMRGLHERALAAMGITPHARWEQDATENPAYQQWRAHPDQPGLHIVHDEVRTITEIHCCVRYQRNVFQLLCGAMAWLGANIVSARVRQLQEGIALVTLGIQTLNETSFALETRKLAQLPELIHAALSGDLNFADELPTRRRIRADRTLNIAPSVYCDNQISAQATVIEINARDRIGLLYDVLGALESCGLQVMTAHIATYGSKAVDVFYVKDAFGLKIYHRDKLAQLQRTLLAALAPDA